jgi:DNA-binding response OmpR family regulator
MQTVHARSMKLLLIEDDTDLSTALGRVLSRRGFEVQTIADGLEALTLLQRGRFDAILLDVTIPGIDGVQLLKRLRTRGDRTPVLVLTARGSVGDRVTGLNAGADDYLAKPFDLDELEARVRALLRRVHGEDRLRCGNLLWDRGTGVVYLDDRPLELGVRESALLSALLATPGQAVTRERLHCLVFDDDATVQMEALEVLVHRVRKKILGAKVELMTLRGLGYLLRADDVAAPP